MHCVVDAMHSALKATRVANVAEEEAKPGVVAEHLTKLVLLQLVAGEDDDALRVEIVDGIGQERFTEGPGGTGDPHRRSAGYRHFDFLPGGGQKALRAEMITSSPAVSKANV